MVEPTAIQLCPLECECSRTETGLFVNCSGIHFSQWPNDIPSNVEHLDLSNNSLTELDLNILLQLTDLRVLNMADNQIQSIVKLVSLSGS